MTLLPRMDSPILRCALLIPCCLLLTACGLSRQLSPVSIIAPEIRLEADSDWAEADWAVQVQRPMADRMRDSERVLVRTAPSRLQPYPGTAWLDNLPDMVLALTIQALQDSGRFQAVARAGGLRTRFALATELRRFDAVDDGGDDLQVELVIQGTLIAQRSGRVLATQTFQVSEPSRGKDIDPLVLAFERALSRYFQELTGWILVEGAQAEEDDEDRRRDWRERRQSNPG